MRFKPLFRLAPVLLAALLTSSFLAFSAEERPNIVFILADDMGYGDVQALNPDSRIPTPNLNRLAGEGMMFTDAHSPSAVCTPTRYATLTGRYSWRSRLKGGVLNGYGAPLIEKERATVASHLAEHGYRTAVIGKWHLGLGFQKKDGEWDWSQPLDYSPVDVGFQRSLVIPASLDFPPYVYIEGHRITGLPDRTQDAVPFPAYLRKGELGSDFSIEDCLDVLTEKSATYIREQAKTKEPFFLYFPLTAPHKPVLPQERFRGKTELGAYGDFVAQVDWTVGEILKAIEDAGIVDNTAVFYTSDNGSFMHRLSGDEGPGHVEDETVQAFHEDNHTANGPFRGTKADIWEAGHRVPFFVRWPAQVEAGSSCDRTICHVDLFATAAEMAGTAIPKPMDGAPDSFSLVPLLNGKPGKFKRAPIVHHSGSGMFALRKGPWKLVFGNGSGGRQQPKGQRWGTPYQLFNLSEDLAETNDRYLSEREVVEELSSDLFRILNREHSK